jgi:diguanylate cyclase (GGDEF)-like protein
MATYSDNKLTQLNTLIEMSTLINSSLDPKQVREKVIAAATRLLGTDAGSLLLVDHNTGELFFEVTVGEKRDEIKSIRLAKGTGIAGWVAEHREPVISNNVATDVRFFSGVDIKSGFVTRNMVCVPVIAKDRLIGVLQAINKREGDFSDDDATILFALANQVAIAIENAKLFQESITDGLTGLYHHKYFELRLREELDRSKRYRNPLSLAMVDIDFFKKVNDEHGHLAGDQVLRGLAAFLKKATRLSDIAARYGGEEFALVLPYVTEKDMHPIGERLRKDVEAGDFNGIRITISIGIAYFDGGNADITMAQFIEAADKALYRAKNSGRNRVEVVFLKGT